MKMTIYEIGEIEDEEIIIGMIVSTYQNKNVYVRHKDRKTYEIPGGHRENNETMNVFRTSKSIFRTFRDYHYTKKYAKPDDDRNKNMINYLNYELPKGV